MSDQIEMSTAEKSEQNMIHQTVNFLGKPVMVRSTFTFNPAAKVNVVPNCTWTPYNTSMANAADRMATFNSWPKQMVRNLKRWFLQDSTTQVMEMLFNVSIAVFL